MPNDSPRSAVYSILLVCALAIVCAHIANAELVFEPSIHRAEGDTSPTAPSRIWPKERPNPMPTYSSNDRSRWCTIRALVDEGTWVIGRRRIEADGSYHDEGIVFEEGWKTLDKVLDPTPHENGQIKVQYYYSSKPPLLSVIAAGEYWSLKHLVGWSITTQTNLVVKTIDLTMNAVPFLLALLMLRRLFERFGASDWGRIFAFSAACFGTFVTTFATTLNNHTPAAVTTLAAIYPLLMSSDDRPMSPFQYLVSGFFAGLTACLELPAAALVGLMFLVMCGRNWRGAVLLFLPAAILPAAVETLINYSAIHQWLPIQSKFGGPWYEYPGSYWLKPEAGTVKHGIDWARTHETIGAYCFHVLIGHHGLFSLTPIWLFSFVAMVVGTTRKDLFPRFLAPMTLVMSIAVIAFYLVETNNYGGWTSGLRWLIWMTTPWLLMLLPAADWLGQRKWSRWLGYAFLAISVFSASFPSGNPWRHPWLYQLMEAQGWIHY